MVKSFIEHLNDTAESLSTEIPTFILHLIERSLDNFDDTLEISTYTLRPLVLKAIGITLAKISSSFSHIVIADSLVDDSALAEFLSLIIPIGHHFGSQSSQALAELARKSPSLEEIHLDWCNLGDNDQNLSKVMIGLTASHSIQKIDLRNNKIKDSGAVFIADFLKNNNSIKELDLRYNSISQGAKLILNSIEQHCRSIVKLELGVNSVEYEVLSRIESALERNKSFYGEFVRKSTELEDEDQQRDFVSSYADQKLFTRLQATSQANERLSSVVNGLNEKIQELNQENGQLERKVSTLEDRNHNLEGQLNEVLADNARLSADLKELQSHQKDSASSFTRSQRNYEAQVEDLRDRVATLSSDKEGLEKDVTSLQRLLNEEKERRLSEVEECRSEREHDLRLFEKELASLREDTKLKISKLKSEGRTLEELRLQAEESLSECRSDLDKQKSKQQQSLADLESKLERHWDHRVKSESKKVKELTEEIFELKQEINVNEKKFITKEAELRDELNVEKSKKEN
ncbi:hypothetical protein GEMRC1_002327 [Eukaryota sp. GEM-RC1]